MWMVGEKKTGGNQEEREGEETNFRGEMEWNKIERKSKEKIWSGKIGLSCNRFI